tara:strand:+ start:39 stop:662 length:624 start_codon:yes stop_codon:yes gene_type:complete
MSASIQTPIQKRHREMIKRENFNTIFGFGLKELPHLQDIIVKLRNQIWFDDITSKSNLINDLNKKIFHFNARIDVKKKSEYASQKASKKEVPEFISEVMNLRNEIKNKYQYLDSVLVCPMEKTRKLCDHYQHTHERSRLLDNGFETNIHPSLLLYFGKPAFMRYVNYEDLTEYFTKTGTIRSKFNYRLAPKELSEFIFKLIEQVKKN